MYTDKYEKHSQLLNLAVLARVGKYFDWHTHRTRHYINKNWKQDKTKDTTVYDRNVYVNIQKHVQMLIFVAIGIVPILESCQ